MSDPLICTEYGREVRWGHPDVVGDLVSAMPLVVRALKDPEAHAAMISELLRTPVRMMSFGPAADQKVWG